MDGGQAALRAAALKDDVAAGRKGLDAGLAERGDEGVDGGRGSPRGEQKGGREERGRSHRW